MQLRFISDPGHGWLEVPLSQLTDLKITGAITDYSYRRGEYAYLEEDMDAGTFMEAYRARHGQEPTIQSVYQENTPIRSYQRYHP